MFAGKTQDGRVVTVERREPVGDEIALDAMPLGFGPWVLDPQNPRRAIVAPKPEPTYAERRAAEYPTTDALVVALWERVVEGRPEASEALQAQRAAVKAKWPKT